MPEATEDAAFLIAASWQALGRAGQEEESTRVCDCTVVLVFAAFFIEANLNYLIEQMNEQNLLNTFFKPRHPGLKDKLYWFYSQHGRGLKIFPGKGFSKEFIEEINLTFPGFKELSDFRNDVAHGHINKDLATIKTTQALRQNAKDIVNKLFEMAEAEGQVFERMVTYQMAIQSKGNEG